MLLPNKLFSYNQSTLSKLPIFLRSLEEPQSPKTLYHSLTDSCSNPMEFMDVLDCLYALCKIDIDEEGRIYKC